MFSAKETGYGNETELSPNPGDGGLFSPGIWWLGLRMNLSGSAVWILQMYLQGVRPLRVLSLRAKLQAAMKSARCVRS